MAISGEMIEFEANLPNAKSTPQLVSAAKTNPKFIKARLKNLPESGR